MVPTKVMLEGASWLSHSRHAVYARKKTKTFVIDQSENSHRLSQHHNTLTSYLCTRGKQ